MTFIEQYKGLDRQIYLLAVVRCVNSMGQMFVFPFTSLLLTQVLGFSAVKAGYFMLLTSVVNATSHAVGGKLADRMSRRKIIFTSPWVAWRASSFVPSTCLTRLPPNSPSASHATSSFS